VHVLTPPEGPGTIPGQRSPEAEITSGGTTKFLEVKTATRSPPEAAIATQRLDKAVTQIAGEGGEISLDFLEVDLAHSPDLKNAVDIESFISGKMTDHKLNSVTYLEVVWKAPDGTIMVTSRRRAADGSVAPVTTKIL
jgi:hypothetical protein